MRKRGMVAFGLPVLALAAAAEADTFGVSGLAGTGVTAQVTFNYSAIDATSGTIAISIENTTPDSGSTEGARISAFAFNTPSGFTITSIGGDVDDAGAQAATALVAPNESGWHARYDGDNIDTPNAAGDFDFGVMNSDNVQAFITDGVGSSVFIIPGETTSFELAVVGTGLSSLTTADFLNALSVNGTAGQFSFGVRFQGIGPQGLSDLAVPGDTPPIPLPASAVLGLLGLGGVGAVRRRYA